jgi:hypothetical protein
MCPIAPSGPPSRDRCPTRYRSLVEPTSTGCSPASQTSRPCLRTQHRFCSPRNHAQLRPGALRVRCRLHTVAPPCSRTVPSFPAEGGRWPRGRPQRHDDVARLERARGGLRQHRRVEHEVLGADDGRPAPPQQPSDVGVSEAAALDEDAASGCTRTSHSGRAS